MKKLMIVLAVLLASFSARAQRPDWNGGGIYFGDSVILGNFYEMNSTRSSHFAIDALGVVVPLSKSGTVDFRANLRYTYDNLFFKDQITLRDSPLGPVPVPIVSDSFKKSKLRFHSVSVPVGFGINAGDFTFGALVAPGLVFSSSTKYKLPKTKADLSDYNKFTCRVEGVVSYSGIGFYVNYGLTPLFEENVYGDDARTLSIGIVLGF